jgi:hypothetical protein
MRRLPVSAVLGLAAIVGIAFAPAAGFALMGTSPACHPIASPL